MLNSRNYAVLTAMLSAAGLLPMSAMAGISFTEGGERLINTLHTHLYSPSSGLSSSDEIKLAAVCFINDTSACSGEAFGNTENSGGNGSSGGVPDYDLNDAERCRKEGYTLTSCAAGETPEGFCIYNSNYFARCVCPSGYKTCEPPYYGVGTACGNKYASCKEDTERACKELDSEFTDTCQSGWKVDPNNTCEYDATFGKCCNLCEGYDYTTIPEGYIADGAACVDCNGTSKYKIKINPCDGFQDCGVMGGDTGAKTCMSGSQIKYDNCKPCPNLGTLSSCPSPFTCTYEECSNRYYKSGCQSGYDWNASSKTCTAQCSSDYLYTCKGTEYRSGVGESCGGKYKSCYCSSNYFWSTFECCKTTYQYTCTGTNEVRGTGSSCGGKYEDCICKDGYNRNNGKCTKIEWGTCTGLAANCDIGDILNTDGSCGYSKESEKTPLAIVTYKSGNCGQAIALTEIKAIWANKTNLTDISTLTNYSSAAAASQDYASFENTAKIISAGDKSKYPAAWAAYEYSSVGTQAGDWSLPAAGIFSVIRENLNVINSRISEVYGTQISSNSLYWTSTETSSEVAWVADLTRVYGLYGGRSKSIEYKVRPVIEF